MAVAAIDIGTNSTRLLIAHYHKGSIYTIYTDLKTTRIGEGMGSSRFIQPQVLSRTIRCLDEYREKCQSYGVEQIQVVATSAVRDAANQEWVVEEIRKATGLEVQVLAGPLEAKLSYMGAISGATVDQGSRVVLDIGGGSTELIYPTPLGLEYRSVNLGAVRLQESPASVEEIQQQLAKLITKDFPKDFTLVGVGGTITTLAAIKLGLERYEPEQVDGFILRKEDVNCLYQQLVGMSPEERKSIKGLQPQRADIIPYGTLILREVLKLLNTPTLMASEKDILQGIIINYINGHS